MDLSRPSCSTNANNPRRGGHRRVFDELIAFARAITSDCQDAAYATLIYGRERLSILSRRAAETAVELHSEQELQHDGGARFRVSSARVVAAVAEVKGNIDSGQFRRSRWRRVRALPTSGLWEIAHYQRRLRGLVNSEDRRLQVKCRAAPSICTPAPRGTASGMTFANAEEASQYLIKEYCISTVPWDDAGAYLRFAATFESAGNADDKRVLAELGRRLAGAGLVF